VGADIDNHAVDRDKRREQLSKLNVMLLKRRLEKMGQPGCPLARCQSQR
jgi:hypothetical protein